MNITVKYTGKDFWGGFDYREDVKNAATIEELKQALKGLKKAYDFALHIDGAGVYGIFWDSMEEYKNEVVTVRTYSEYNPYSYEEEKKSFTALKRDLIKKYGA